MAEFEKNEFQFPDEKEPPKPAAAKPDTEDLQVEIVEDTPKEDQGRKPIEKTPDQIAPDEEAQQYSAAVQKRIQELKHATHDERRAKEAAGREREAAIAYAKSVHEENQRLKQYIQSGEKVYGDTIKSASSTELVAAKTALKQAYESGDAEKVAEATEALSLAKMRTEVAANWKPSTLQQTEFAVPSAPAAPAATPPPDDKALKWQSRNQWFGNDPEATSFALGLHKKLIDEGINPTSDAYYERVNARMKEKFPELVTPDEQKGEQQRQPASVVAPAGRASGPRKVVLTVSQQNIARRLGLSPKQYAEQVMLLEQRNG